MTIYLMTLELERNITWRLEDCLWHSRTIKHQTNTFWVHISCTEGFTVTWGWCTLTVFFLPITYIYPPSASSSPTVHFDLFAASIPSVRYSSLSVWLSSMDKAILKKISFFFSSWITPCCVHILTHSCFGCYCVWSVSRLCKEWHAILCTGVYTIN